jgi:DNA-3-methyladenine glycosylase
VYLSYGMHECLNIVAEREGEPGCVLIRALEPVKGIETMRARRPGIRTDRDLTSGPGRLTKALAITRAHNGVDVTHGDLNIRRAKYERQFEIEVTPRIGITKCVDWPLRFVIRGNKYVSR